MIGNTRIRILKEAALYLGLLLVLYLFYKSALVIIPFIPCAVFLRKIRREQNRERDRKELNGQFGDMLAAMSAALRAGYSVENSIAQCAGEMEIVYGKDSLICSELSFMMNQLEMGISAEEIFREFSLRARVEDIDTFSSIFSIAKRTGGNMVEIISRTSAEISDRIDTGKEIEVLVSAKKLENNIMTLLPAVTILYIDLTSPGLLAPLYGNAAGIAIMTVCLIIYALACLLAARIMNIEV